MSGARDKALHGVVLDRRVTYSLREFCNACGVESELVVEMIGEGVIEAAGAGREDWRFTGESLVRARRAVRLVRDLGINWPGAALALDLLELLDDYERRLAGRDRSGGA